MVRTNLFLVRHADSRYTPEELTRPLSAKGFEDAAKVTEHLADKDIDVFVSSAYLRAVQTIEGAADKVGKEILIREGFRERLLAGKPVEDFSSAIARVWSDWRFSWEGGESNEDAQARGVQAALEVLEEFAGRNVAVGTHGNIMVLIMNYFDSAYGFEFWKELEMPDIYQLSFEGERLLEVDRIWK